MNISLGNERNLFIIRTQFLQTNLTICHYFLIALPAFQCLTLFDRIILYNSGSDLFGILQYDFQQSNINKTLLGPKPNHILSYMKIGITLEMNVSMVPVHHHLHFLYFSGLSDTMVGAETISPLFPFPFYGHVVDDFYITTHGFLSLSPRLHDYIYKTQYIAPLRIKV